MNIFYGLLAFLFLTFIFYCGYAIGNFIGFQHTLEEERAENNFLKGEVSYLTNEKYRQNKEIEKLERYNTLKELLNTLEFDVFSNGSAMVNIDGEKVLCCDGHPSLDNDRGIVMNHIIVNKDLVLSVRTFELLQRLVENYPNEIVEWILNDKNLINK